jgi:hypothetical protein
MDAQDRDERIAPGVLPIMKRNQTLASLIVLGSITISVSGCVERDTPESMVSSEPVTSTRADSTETQKLKSTGTKEEAESNKSDPDSDTPTLPDLGGAESAAVEPPPKEAPNPMDPPEGGLRADPESEVWIDPQKRAVIVHGFVCFREGPLEMFACPRNTKEHESIVSVQSSAQLIHAALLGIGAEKGQPVQFLPEFRPPSGTQIDIEVEWEDEAGELHTARAQDWVRDARTQQAMEHPWVFAGSGFWKDPAGKEHYQAEAGDLICVSNFASATLDIPVESTQANEGLAFEAFTEKIPPLGTPVRLILTPKLQGSPDEPSPEQQRPPL